jgi:hypothetical protein
MKSVTFCWAWISPEKDKKPHLKFYIEEVVLRIYRMMPRVLGFGG